MQSTISKQNETLYAIEGELTMASVPSISKQFDELFSSTASGELTINFASVSRSDSAGVALMVELIQLAKIANLSLFFSNLPQQMQDIANLSGLLDILPLSKN